MKILNENYQPEYPISRLVPHPENAREGDVGAITTAIEDVGFYGAVIVQKSTGYILAGKHRMLSAAETGSETVPVIFVDVDDRTARRILAGDNRMSDLAKNDEAALLQLLRNIEADGPLSGTGYDSEDLARLIADVNRQGLNIEPEQAPPAEKPAKKEKTAAVDPGAVPPAPAPPTADGARFEVTVSCTSEEQQGDTLERLVALGFNCRIA